MRQPVVVTVTDSNGLRVSRFTVDYGSRDGRRSVANVASEALANGHSVTTRPEGTATVPPLVRSNAADIVIRAGNGMSHDRACAELIAKWVLSL